jgi:hypothetical protein
MVATKRVQNEQAFEADPTDKRRGFGRWFEFAHGRGQGDAFPSA